MNEIDAERETELIRQIQSGNSEAFEALIEPLKRSLFAFIYRMVTERDAAEDLKQEVLLKAFENLPRFRGKSRFRTWLFKIAVNACLDYLQSKNRWRAEAQLVGEEDTDADSAQLQKLESLMSKQDFVYEIREHIAFCFSCIGRTLTPEEQAAIMLREIIGLGNQEAADAMGVSEPVFRHKLSAARSRMIEIYEGMCALINKQGVCDQCRSLREFAPAGKQGRELIQITVGRNASITPESLFDERLQIVKKSDLENGSSKKLHTLFFAGLTAQEEISSPV